MSIALWLFIFSEKSYRIVFVPANWDGKADPGGRWQALGPGDVALDLMAGGDGIKGNPSAFSEVLKRHGKGVANLLANLTAYIDAVDDGKVHNDEYTLQRTFHAMAKAVQDPKQLVDFCLMFLRGELQIQQDRVRAWVIAQTAEWVTNELVIMRQDAAGVNGLLFEQGARVIVFENPNSVGILRREGYKLNLADGAVVEFLQSTGEPIQHMNGGTGWFIHPQGFLVTSKSRVAEATFTTTVTADQLAAVVQTMM